MRSYCGLPPGDYGYVNDQCCSTGGFTLDDVVSSPTQVYDASEKTKAAYLQASYKIGEVVDGVIGLRAVQTKTGVRWLLTPSEGARRLLRIHTGKR